MHGTTTASSWPTNTVPLPTHAWARSGDEGDNAHIGVIARQPECVGHLRGVPPEAVRAQLGHFVKDPREFAFLVADDRAYTTGFARRKL